MTGFDVAAGAILLVSGLAGFVRGATREVTTAIALLAALAAAILSLHLSAPIARHFIHAPWLASVVAGLSVFLIVYVAVRLAGGHLIRGVRQTALSGFDRALGLVIGLARGMIAIGLFVLLIRAATPPERMPQWLTGSRAWPMADAAANGLRALAPRGMQMAKHVGPAIENALSTSAANADDEDRDEPSAASGAAGSGDK
jgi:membrane protein required for colicin V production